MDSQDSTPEHSRVTLLATSSVTTRVTSVGQYVGNYSRAFAGEYTGTFVGPALHWSLNQSTELVNEGDFDKLKF